MRRYALLPIVLGLLIAFSSSTLAQTRSLGAGALVLDDYHNHYVTLKAPVYESPEWYEWEADSFPTLSWSVPVPPSNNTQGGFVYAGPLTGAVVPQLAYWIPPGDTSLSGDGNHGGYAGAWDYAGFGQLGLVSGTGAVTYLPIWKPGDTSIGKSFIQEFPYPSGRDPQGIEDSADVTIEGSLKVTDSLTVHSITAGTGLFDDILPSHDTMSNLGADTDRFNTLYLGPNSLVMGNMGAQTTFSTSDSGLAIMATGGSDTSSVTFTSAGALGATSLVAGDAVLPSGDTMANLGDTNQRFNTLYLGPNSLVMGNPGAQSSVSTSPSGFSITASSDTDTATVTVSSDGSLSADAVVASTAVLPMQDTMANLGDSTDRFNTLYLGPNSLVMGNPGAQSSVSTSPSGFSITATSDTDSATVTVSSDGSLSSDNVVATTAVLPAQDTMANLGDSADRFNTLYLGPNSLVMGNAGASTSISTSPAGLSITTTSDTDTAVVTVSSDGTLSTSSLDADANVTASGPITSGDSMAAAGTITSGNSVIIDGTSTPRSISGDNTMNISTSSGDILLSPTGNVGVGTPTPQSTLDVNGAAGYGQFRMEQSYTPTSSSDPNGSVGDIAWDTNYIYVKTSAGWKRSALSTF